MLVIAMMWKSTTNSPPATLPNSIIPMPNGIVTMPLPSGITDSAVKKMTSTKNAS